MRVCSICRKQAQPHAQFCCDVRLPPTYSNHHPRTPRGQARVDAQARLLEGMRAPACACGLRGPHECTRSLEWRQEMLSMLSMRQL